MKIFARFIALSCLAMGFSSSLHAAGRAAYEETYNIGILAGSLDGGAEFGTVDATGFLLSARNKKAVLEYVNVSSDSGTVLSTGDEWEANISGFYLSLLGEGQPYIKFKVGKVKHEMILTQGATSTSDVTTVTSYGVGLGYRIGTRIALELDITTLDNDMTLMALSVLF
jgi:hypothetical protein